MYTGLWDLGVTVQFLHQQAGSDGTPADADALPSGRVYSPSGFLPEASVTAAYADQASVTGGSISGGLARLTSAGHNLVTGQRVTVTGVNGLTGANGTFKVTAIDANTFDLQVSAAGGAYTSGGLWHSTGLYAVSVVADGLSGFDAGESYDLRLLASVSSTPRPSLYRFGVV